MALQTVVTDEKTKLVANEAYSYIGAISVNFTGEGSASVTVYTHSSAAAKAAGEGMMHHESYQIEVTPELRDAIYTQLKLEDDFTGSVDV
jgi:hypothetical protein